MNSTLPRAENFKVSGATQFKNPNASLYDLSQVTASGKSTKIFRALGYWNQMPAINQRVINETSLVADYLNRQK